MGLLEKDPLTLTADEEKQIGNALHALILERHRELVSGPLKRRLWAAIEPLYPFRQHKETDYQFTILDSDRINAFSHIGGYIYVTRGVFDLIGDDVELQFILAHEMAHLELKHAARRVSEEWRGAKAGDDAEPGLLQRFYHQIAVGYTLDEENTADDRAYLWLRQLGRTRLEGLRFLRRYIGFVEANQLEAGRRAPKTDLDAGVEDIDNHWPSHPPAIDRFHRLRLMKVGTP